MSSFREIADFIWSIADEVLRDDFKRGKYPDVILPFTVLRRLDCVLAPTREKVRLRQEELKEKGLSDTHAQLCRASGYAFYNTSRYDFPSLLNDPKNLSKNLRAYMNGFSENMRDIVDKFKLRATIETLDEMGLLFMLVEKFCDKRLDLHPDSVDNHTMGSIFEELIRKFNEQANENPGEHFTPREVIRLMVRLVINGDAKVLKHGGVLRTILDPACGTGGMLSVAKEYIHEEINAEADIRLFGQEVNPETYAMCKSDMLIKGDDRDADNIKPDSCLSKDGHAKATFDYMLCNPPYGKDWKKDQKVVRREAERGYAGRFGPGLPRISDGQMLFMMHLLSKMKPISDGGSRIAIIMNGSPLFTGDAGGGESEMRRWILEKDWLETIVALPEQLFYNTGIATYIWVLTNRKEPRRHGKVQLVDATSIWTPLQRSLGEKRREISTEQVGQIARLHRQFEANEQSKLFDIADFGYRKITVERPLRLNFQASSTRIERVWQQSAFLNLAVSRKRSGPDREADEANGKELQERTVALLQGLPQSLYQDRAEFEEVLLSAAKEQNVKLSAVVRRAILNALSERDQTAAMCVDAKGDPEPDPDLRDSEYVPLTESITDYMRREVLPHVPDAWVSATSCDHKDGEVGKVGYEINVTRHFYRYEPPRPLQQIEADMRATERQIAAMLDGGADEQS